MIKLKENKLITRMRDVFIAVTILYYTIELCGLVPKSHIWDVIIWILFIIYFVFKFFIFKTNILKKELLDFVPLIPFFLISNNDLSDFVRYIVLLALVFDYVIDYIEDFIFHKPLILVTIIYTIIMSFGTVGYIRFEGMTFGEGFWLAFISSTTVGYGDVSAVTVYGKLITIFVVIAGAVLFGAVLITIVMNMINDRRQAKLKELEEQQDSRIYENEEYVMMLFDEFSKGNINLNELRVKVLRELNKKDEIEENDGK